MAIEYDQVRYFARGLPVGAERLLEDGAALVGVLEKHPEYANGHSPQANTVTGNCSTWNIQALGGVRDAIRAMIGAEGWTRSINVISRSQTGEEALPQDELLTETDVSRLKGLGARVDRVLEGDRIFA